MLVRLIEEGLFLSHAEKCGVDSQENALSDDRRYLTEQVFPTLVPGLYDLLKCYKNRIADEENGTFSDNKYPDPVMWLAQYLIRNNTHHSTSRLIGHPFQVVNNAVLDEDSSDE